MPIQLVNHSNANIMLAAQYRGWFLEIVAQSTTILILNTF